MCTPRDIQAGVPQGCFLSATLYSIYTYTNDKPKTPGIYLGLFAFDTCIYATDRKDGGGQTYAFQVTKMPL
jgi:hypothetical protein